MSAHFLLDTNVLSEPLKPRPNPKVVKRLADQGDTLATAAIAYHELKFGHLTMPESRRKRDIDVYIGQAIEDKLLILPYGEAAANWHANERARLSKQGLTPPYADGQIAAIAAVNRLVLVTRNIADYKNFQDLALENWFE